MTSNTRNPQSAAGDKAAFRQQHSNLYPHIFDYLTIGIYVYHLENRDDDRTLRMVDANPYVVELAGLTPDQIIGKTLDENFPGLRDIGLPQAFAEVIRTGEPFVTEVVYGDERIIESAFSVRAVPLPGDCVAVMFDNITQHKQAEADIRHLNAELEQRIRESTAELQRSQSLLQSVINNSPSAIYVKDLEGRFVLANMPTARLMGLTPEQLVNKIDTELFPAEYVTQWRDNERKVIESGQPLQLEETAPQADGLHTFLSVRVPVYDEHGAIYAIGGISTDITSQKRAEAERATFQEQLIDAQRSAIRELSTPLIPIADGIVIMPLIGTIDSLRAQQVMDSLLEGVAAYRAHMVILDITGVQVVDTQVADTFIQAARAVRLLGARVMLTGIQPQIAYTLVQLGVDLNDMDTRSSLQAGITTALQLQ